jgi:hypothetical protein
MLISPRRSVSYYCASRGFARIIGVAANNVIALPVASPLTSLARHSAVALSVIQPRKDPTTSMLPHQQDGIGGRRYAQPGVGIVFFKSPNLTARR